MRATAVAGVVATAAATVSNRFIERYSIPYVMVLRRTRISQTTLLLNDNDWGGRIRRPSKVTSTAATTATAATSTSSPHINESLVFFNGRSSHNSCIDLEPPYPVTLSTSDDTAGNSLNELRRIYGPGERRGRMKSMDDEHKRDVRYKLGSQRVWASSHRNRFNNNNISSSGRNTSMGFVETNVGTDGALDNNSFALRLLLLLREEGLVPHMPIKVAVGAPASIRNAVRSVQGGKSLGLSDTFDRHWVRMTGITYNKIHELLHLWRSHVLSLNDMSDDPLSPFMVAQTAMCLTIIHDSRWPTAWLAIKLLTDASSIGLINLGPTAAITVMDGCASVLGHRRGTASDRDCYRHAPDFFDAMAAFLYMGMDDLTTGLSTLSPHELCRVVRAFSRGNSNSMLKNHVLSCCWNALNVSRLSTDREFAKHTAGNSVVFIGYCVAGGRCPTILNEAVRYLAKGVLRSKSSLIENGGLQQGGVIDNLGWSVAVLAELCLKEGISAGYGNLSLLVKSTSLDKALCELASSIGAISPDHNRSSLNRGFVSTRAILSLAWGMANMGVMNSAFWRSVDEVVFFRLVEFGNRCGKSYNWEPIKPEEVCMLLDSFARIGVQPSMMALLLSALRSRPDPRYPPNSGRLIRPLSDGMETTAVTSRLIFALASARIMLMHSKSEYISLNEKGIELGMDAKDSTQQLIVESCERFWMSKSVCKHIFTSDWLLVLRARDMLKLSYGDNFVESVLPSKLVAITVALEHKKNNMKKINVLHMEERRLGRGHCIAGKDGVLLNTLEKVRSLTVQHVMRALHILGVKGRCNVPLWPHSAIIADIIIDNLPPDISTAFRNAYGNSIMVDIVDSLTHHIVDSSSPKPTPETLAKHNVANRAGFCRVDIDSREWPPETSDQVIFVARMLFGDEYADKWISKNAKQPIEDVIPNEVSAI